MAIYIDGVSLVQLVGAYEEARGYIPAGSYSFVPIRALDRPEQHFLGKPERPQADGRVTLLLCECLIDGCWNFNTRIAVGPDQVTWSDFEQPHRRAGSRAGHWSYGDFGPLTFDRRHYTSSLAAIRTVT